MQAYKKSSAFPAPIFVKLIVTEYIFMDLPNSIQAD
jgi:hypothetical protein